MKKLFFLLIMSPALKAHDMKMPIKFLKNESTQSQKGLLKKSPLPRRKSSSSSTSLLPESNTAFPEKGNIKELKRESE